MYLGADSCDLTAENTHAYLSKDVKDRVQTETHREKRHSKTKEGAENQVELSYFRQEVKQTHTSEHIDYRAQFYGF